MAGRRNWNPSGCKGQAKQYKGKDSNGERGGDHDDVKIDLVLSNESKSGADMISPARVSVNSNALALRASGVIGDPMRVHSEGCQTGEMGGWSPHDALCYANRNLWTVFLSQGLLRPIIKHITMLTAQDRTEHVLDIVLRQPDGKISDEETIGILRTINWESSDSAALLNKPAVENLSANAWRFLARAQTSALRRGCDTLSFLWTFHGLHDRLPSMRTGTFWYKHIDYEEYTFQMKIGKRPGQECRSGDAPDLVLCVELMHSECLAPYLLERRIKFSITFTLTKCSCGDSMYLTEVAGQALEGMDVNSLTI